MKKALIERMEIVNSKQFKDDHTQKFLFVEQEHMQPQDKTLSQQAAMRLCISELKFIANQGENRAGKEDMIDIRSIDNLQLINSH